MLIKQRILFHVRRGEIFHHGGLEIHTVIEFYKVKPRIGQQMCLYMVSVFVGQYGWVLPRRIGQCNQTVATIMGHPGDYNHLFVRCPVAASIVYIRVWERNQGHVW